MSIKRYMNDLDDMVEHRNGDFVTYEDHAAEVARLNEVISETTKRSDRLHGMFNAGLERQGELNEQVQALAAEVQAVRWASGQVYARGYNHGHLNTVDCLPYAEEKDLVIRGGEALCEYIDPDHCGVPTDAILSEVRAQGAIDARNALVVAGDGADIYGVVTDVATRIRAGEVPNA